MLRYDLTSFRLFLTVYQEGNISKAAAREHIAPSALSKRLAELEQLLGAQLFQRLPNGVRPTDAADALAKHAQRLMLALAQIRADLADYGTGIRGQLHVMANTSAILSGFVEKIQSYMKDYPDVCVDVQESVSPAIIRSVAEGLADLGIFADNIDPGNLQVVPYKDVRLLLVVPQDHPLADRAQISFVEAMPYDFVGLSERDNLVTSIFMSVATAENPDFKLRMKAISFESLRRMVEAGIGITVMPEYSCLPYAGPQKIACIPLTDEWGKFKLKICMRDMDTLPTAARLLVKRLTSSDEDSAAPRLSAAQGS